MDTTLAATPVPADALSPAKVAEILVTSAELIERHGLYRGDYWPDSESRRWTEGTPCCLAGAIAVSLGHREVADAAHALYGALPADDDYAEVDPDGAHPALVALMEGTPDPVETRPAAAS